MISEQQQEDIKKVLGHRYSKIVQKQLNIDGYVNSNNLPYSTEQIRNVMNGVPHAIIEEAIWKCVSESKQKELQRQELLNT